MEVNRGMEVKGPGAAFWIHLLSARGDWVSYIGSGLADDADSAGEEILTISPTRCLSFPPQCLMPVLRYCSLGSSFMLALLPSQPCSPNSCFTGERERLVGLRRQSAGWSSLISSSLLGEAALALGGSFAGEGVRRIDRPRTGEGSGGLSRLPPKFD